MPTVIGCLDRAMRVFGGVPTYWLTDNERTVTIDHVAGVAVRHPEMVALGGHYGVTVATCVPADPESKGGVEATVRIAKADLVPTDINLRDDYQSWGELVEACEAFMADVNGRPHRVTRRAPATCWRRNGSVSIGSRSGLTRRCSVRPDGCRGQPRSATGV